jgi:hypothetical protein
MGLTDEQKTKLRSVNREFIDQVRALPTSPREEVAGKKRGDMESKLRQDRAVKAMAVLTVEQKAKWKELTGEPFDVERYIFRVGGTPPQRQPQEQKKTGS